MSKEAVDQVSLVYLIYRIKGLQLTNGAYASSKMFAVSSTWEPQKLTLVNLGFLCFFSCEFLTLMEIVWSKVQTAQLSSALQ